MYDPNDTYWLQVFEDQLTKEDLYFIDRLYIEPSESGRSVYVAILVSENDNNILLYPENSVTFATMIDPHIFMKLVRLYSIDKEIAKLACIDLLKKGYV